MEKITSYIFPFIEVIDKENGSLEFKTVVRKQDPETGDWYYCNVSEKANPNFPTFGNKKITKEDVIKKLIINSYNLMICGIIDKNSTDDFKIFNLDDNQQSEQERIINYINI